MQFCIATLLGTGTSQGVPMIGYEYPPEFLANPKNHRFRCAVHFQGPGSVLVDCPPELRLQIIREEIMKLDCVVVTHTHADHIMGMDDLRPFCDLQKQVLPIYTLPGHFEDIQRIFPYAFREAPPGITYPRFALHSVEETAILGGMPFQFFSVQHGSMQVVAMRVGTFGYMTDVKHVPEEGYQIMEGVESLVIDGLRSRAHPTHFNFEEAIAFSREVHATRTYLTHLTHESDHDITNASLPDGVELAYDRLRIVFAADCQS